jgi:hypothetical protein
LTWLLALIPWEWLAAIGGIVAALLATWLGGRRSAKTAAKIETLQNEDKAHDRINKADTGAGLSDSDRVGRLRDYAKRHGN